MDFLKIGTGWPKIFTRKKIEHLTGGGISARTLANLDCLGQGPPGRFRIGRKTVYERDLFLQWLSDRAQEVPTPGTDHNDVQ